MDYEKKYKEALERARQFSEKPYLEDSKGIVDYIFPELKESEDEKIRKSLIDMLKNDEKCYLEEIAWLEKQGEQKPAEWSVVDETMLTNTIIMLKEGASLHFNKKDITKAVDWLKSLSYRSHWKPSEEQMKVLDEVIRNPHLSTDEYNGLIALKKQLKTQKGESV